MSKPFNLADAKLGHPVTTEIGGSVKLHDFNFEIRGTGTAVMGVLTDAFPRVAYWLHDGTPILHAGCITKALVMAPLGTVDGREVYPGDMLLNRFEELVPVPYGVAFDPGMWSWPVPVRIYPVTQQDGVTLLGAIGGYKHRSDMENAILIANAAIRHGIDNGYLLDPHGGIAFMEAKNEVERKLKVMTATNDNNLNGYRELARILSEIAKGAGITGTYHWVDVAPAVRLREVAIARHFYTHIGYPLDQPAPGRPMPPDVFFTTELTKVK